MRLVVYENSFRLTSPCKRNHIPCQQIADRAQWKHFLSVPLLTFHFLPPKGGGDASRRGRALPCNLVLRLQVGKGKNPEIA